MSTHYEILLKEQLMYNLLGYSSQTLNDYTKQLTIQFNEDIQQISQAYFIVSRELFGRPVE